MSEFIETGSKLGMVMLWFKFMFGLFFCIFLFSKQFDVYFSLSYIHYHNVKERKIKSKLV